MCSHQCGGRIAHTGGGRSLEEWVVTIFLDKYQQATALRVMGPWDRVLSYWRILLDNIYPSGSDRSGHRLDDVGNVGHTRSSDRGEREREFSSNGG